MISIIIPTYNHLEDCLKPCIESIIQNTDLSSNIEIIIVSNGSTDGTNEYISSLGFPFKLLSFAEPLGYTKAINEGLKIAQGDYIILLNNDCVILPYSNWLEILKKPFEDPHVAMTGPFKSNYPGTDLKFLLFFCVMIRKTIINELGLLDEIFNPGYGEDIDYAQKILKLGYKILQVPNEETHEFPIWHKESQTVHSVPQWEQIVKRNDQILRNRYKKYSIIIPTYNHLEDCLKPCIESILRNTDLNLTEVIIVANGCNEDTKNFINQLPEQFKLIWSEEQLGYIKAINLGLEKSIGEYVILLNNDVKITSSNWIQILENPFKDNKTGISGPHKSWIHEINQDYMLFFCVMMKKELINRIGLLDEQFGLGYLEDVDYSIRIKNAGYNLVQVPNDIYFSKDKTYREDMIDQFPIIHKGGTTFDAVGNRELILENNLKLLKNKIDSFVEQKHQINIGINSDINQHLSTLRKYADQCETIVEFGVRSGISTWSLLSSKPKKMTSYDWHKWHKEVEEIELAAKNENIDFTFYEKDVLKVEIEQTDLLFIDSMHNYYHLSSELALHSNKVNKYIILHDTVFHGEKGMLGDYEGGWSGEEGTGLQKAINEFLDKNSNWKIKEHYRYNNGLMILEKQNDLPDGFFGKEDIEFYRDCISELEDNSYIAEVGVWKGRSLCSIADLIKSKNLKVFAIDTFEGFSGDPNSPIENNIFNIFVENISKYDIANHIHIIPKNSFNASLDIPNNCLDFIFIDADHSYEAVRSDIDNWLPKLKNNGIIAGHDYPYCIGVKQAVEETFGNNVESGLRCWKVNLNKKPKIYDCFTFYNELDLLEVRLNELYESVDYFVLVEAKYTHQGNLKPLYFEENKERFKKFLPKIRHIIVNEFPKMPLNFYRNDNPKINEDWWRESFQRNSIKRGLFDCKDDDIIILTDADEIPKAEAIKQYNKSMGLCCLKMVLYYYKLNYKTVDWWKARIFTYSETKNCNIDEFRTEKDYSYVSTIENGGWHFSFLGNTEEIKDKISAWAHREFNISEINNKENIEDAINNARDVLKRDIPFSIVQIDQSYPQFIQNNQNYYQSKGLIYQNSKSKIYDCFLFNDELDLLEIRLNELDDVIDYFVLVEAPYTFSNKEKPLYFEDNKERFSKFLHKIKHIVVKEKPKIVDNWSIEEYQRNSISKGLEDCKDDDIIIISDLDEIINKKILKQKINSIYSLSQNLYYYYLNCYNNTKWEMAKIGKYYYIKNYSINDVRKLINVPIITEAGWHFSYVGGVKSIINKIESFSHQEFNQSKFKDIKYLQSIINSGKDLFQRDMSFNFVSVDNTFPKFVQDNKEKLIKLGLIYEDSKPKIYDCFPFYNELDLLEIRLNELDPYVDYFVITEMTVTHTNFPKPLYFEKNKERFSKFLHKIKYIIVDNFPNHNDPWYRERHQRECLIKGLENCKDNDIIILSDLDEIPKGSEINKFDLNKDYMYFEQKRYDFYLNMYSGIDKADIGVFSKICQFKYLRKIDFSLNQLRYQHIDKSISIPNGGWHFSWLGGGAKVIEKLRAFGHQEVLDGWIEKGILPFESKKSSFIPTEEQIKFVDHAIQNGIDVFNRDQYPNRKFVNIDDSFPQFVIENQHKFIEKKMINPLDDDISKITPAFLEYSVYKAEQGISNINKEIFDIEGMSSFYTRHLFNNIGNLQNINYLEVGSWRGSTACSILSNNNLKSAILIDNFSQFDDPDWIANSKTKLKAKDELQLNLSKYANNNYTIIEADFFTVNINQFPQIDVFLFDGYHSYEHQYKALFYLYEKLAKRFIFIVDDYEWPSVKKATIDAIRQLTLENKVKNLYEKHLPSIIPESANLKWADGVSFFGKWNNGIYLGLFEKV